jgi:type II secretory pathway component PulM
MDAEPSDSPAVNSSEWLQHYDAASKRRRDARGVRRRTRIEMRRRRARERLIMLASAVAVLGLTALFYLVLAR